MVKHFDRYIILASQNDLFRRQTSPCRFGFQHRLSHCRPRTVSTSKAPTFTLSDKLSFLSRAVVPGPVASVPAPAPEPVGLPPRNIVDLAGTRASTFSRRTTSRRQARLVDREPESEQPLLEVRDTPVAVVLEQRSASQSHRYPRRVYFEHYEKRSPDSVVMAPSSSVILKRDGGRHHCCNNGLGMRSIVSVVRLFSPCACGGSSSATMGSMNGSFFTRD